MSESNTCSLVGSTSSSRNEHCSKAVGVLSDEEASSDDDLGPPIFEASPGSSRSERYLRRVQQFSSNLKTAEGRHSSFFSSGNGQARGLSTYRPRLLVCGGQGMGQSTHIAPALLHCMEHMTVYCLDLPALYGVTSKTPEEACSQVGLPASHHCEIQNVQIEQQMFDLLRFSKIKIFSPVFFFKVFPLIKFQLFREARRSSPCVVYSPHFDSLWNATGDSLHATLFSLLQDLPPLAPVLFLATADKGWNHLPSIMQEFFSKEIGQVGELCYWFLIRQTDG